MNCKVCSHPKRKEIEGYIRSDMAPVRIGELTKAKEAKHGAAEWPSVSKGTIWKHKLDCMGGRKKPSSDEGTKAPDTIEARRQYLEDEAFKLLQMGNGADKERTALIKCASDMLEKRAREECFCDRIYEHPEVQAMVKKYEEALAKVMANMCSPCSAKVRMRDQ